MTHAAIAEWQVAQCEWIDDRWHLDGRPIYAGSQMEMLFPDGTWQSVRIESQPIEIGERVVGGRVLYAYIFHHREPFSTKIGFTRKLRWPQKPYGGGLPVDPPGKERYRNVVA